MFFVTDQLKKRLWHLFLLWVWAWVWFLPRSQSSRSDLLLLLCSFSRNSMSPGEEDSRAVLRWAKSMPSTQDFHSGETVNREMGFRNRDERLQIESKHSSLAYLRKSLIEQGKRQPPFTLSLSLSLSRSDMASFKVLCLLWNSFDGVSCSILG